jgi:hypothetical protein
VRQTEPDTLLNSVVSGDEDIQDGCTCIVTSAGETVQRFVAVFVGAEMAFRNNCK